MFYKIIYKFSTNGFYEKMLYGRGIVLLFVAVISILFPKIIFSFENEHRF